MGGNKAEELVFRVSRGNAGAQVRAAGSVLSTLQPPPFDAPCQLWLSPSPWQVVAHYQRTRQLPPVDTFWTSLGRKDTLRVLFERRGGEHEGRVAHSVHMADISSAPAVFQSTPHIVQ